jgi:hypothetical protein
LPAVVNREGQGEKRMEFLSESNRVPIAGSYDVVVVGGGIAGVSAALAARRKGRRVLLIEKSVVLGGLATLGFIAYYLPLCDGRGKKVSAGIAEELLHLSIKYGYHDLQPQWKDGSGVGATKRYTSIFSPPEFIFTLDDVVTSSGIDLLFDTVFCKPIMDGDRCSAVIVENKTGRTAYKAKMFIDSSGDTDLFFRAGSKCVEEKNYLAYWFYKTNLEMMKKAVQSGRIKDGISLEWRGSFLRDGSYTLGEKEYKGTDAKDITRFILRGRELLQKEVVKNSEQNGALLALPGMAQYRRTRRIRGIYCLTESDALKRFDDSIGCTGHWLKPGIVYEIPYRTLVVKGVTNVLAAGRNTSSSGDAWEATRVIPAAAVTGEAAGTAAAVAIKKGCSVTELSVADLQKELKKDGVIIHYEKPESDTGFVLEEAPGPGGPH